MSQRVSNGAVLKRILRLHAEALAVLEICAEIMQQADFYYKYVALSRNYNARLPG